MDKKYYIIGGIIAFLIVVLGAVLLFSNGGTPKPKPQNVELTWWKTFEETENIQDLINEYQQIHKGVTINYVKKDIVDYEKELVDAIASGRTPDIFSIHNDWLPKHMDKLSPAPTNLMTVRQYKDTFVDVASSDFVKDNQIFAIPLAVDVLALYYNKDILGSAGIATPPKDWRELVIAVEKITQQSRPGVFSKSGVAMGTAENINRGVDILTALMLQNGTVFYSPEFTTATFDQSVIDGSGESYNPGQAALEFYTQFANPAKKSYTWNSRSDYSVDAFTQGKVGMMFSYHYMKPVVDGKALTINWGIAPLPQISTTGNKVNFANYWGEGVSKFSGNSAAAWDFLKFISEKESLKKYYANHNVPSSRKDIIAEQISNEEVGVFAEGALTARSVYKKDAPVFEAVFLKMIDDVILRNTDANEAINNAVQQINLSLQR